WLCRGNVFPYFSPVQLLKRRSEGSRGQRNYGSACESQTSLAFPGEVGGRSDTLIGKMEEGSVRSPVPSTGTQVIRQVEPQPADPLGPLGWRGLLPHETAASSVRLGWVGLQAARCCATPAFELNLPPLTHHRILLFARPPEELDLRYEVVKRNVPPRAGSI